mmetsp:Transcript_96027/g.248821  ORF Transcript_96027/g.248821 Transcript_96027/m.248821 type:complete len:345 (-) Transcript_96027:99-1133(-)
MAAVTLARRAVLRRGAAAPFAAFAAPAPLGGPPLRGFAAASWDVMLNYQEPPPAGKRTGRYIDQPDRGDVVDEHQPRKTVMHNGRLMSPPAELESVGFALKACPTQVKDFRNDDEVVKTYYPEMRKLIKEAAGADRVLIFDHTVRESGNTNLNAAAGGSAAPVPRVHCDYTADGAPRRLMQLATTGVYSHMRKRTLTVADFEDLASRRFAFINVWRSISDEAPVERMPLACCDTNSVPSEDKFLYELIFPDRVGENYSLKFNTEHKWVYYPYQTKDECLIFKVYDKQHDGPRFVFHTAFEDPHTTEASPTRKSIEIRAVAFFDGDAEDITMEKAAPPLDHVQQN